MMRKMAVSISAGRRSRSSGASRVTAIPLRRIGFDVAPGRVLKEDRIHRFVEQHLDPEAAFLDLRFCFLALGEIADEPLEEKLAIGSNGDSGSLHVDDASVETDPLDLHPRRFFA